jgi:hypothetical protein
VVLNLYFIILRCKNEITGRTNQLPIDDNVSLQFSGATSVATIEKTRYSSGDITLEWWMLNKTANTAVTILKQANNLEIGLTALNEFFFGKTYNSSTCGEVIYSHFAFTYRKSDGYMAIYKNDKIW